MYGAVCSISRRVGVLKSAPVLRILGHGEASHVGFGFVRPHAQVGIGIEREVGAFVAAIALGLVDEHIHAANLLGVHSALLSPLLYRS